MKMNKREEECKKAGFQVYTAKDINSKGEITFMGETFDVNVLRVVRYTDHHGLIGHEKRLGRVFAEIEIVD